MTKIEYKKDGLPIVDLAEIIGQRLKDKVIAAQIRDLFTEHQNMLRGKTSGGDFMHTLATEEGWD